MSDEIVENPFVDFVKTYRNNPVGFVKHVLKVEPDPWQAEVLNALATGERKLSIRSGHGVGKTAMASWSMIWFLMTRYPVKVVCTSPTSSQLMDGLFAEIKLWLRELPEILMNLLEVKSDRIMLKATPTEAFISARFARSEQPEALAGIHSQNVLILVDEASGVPEQVFEAGYGSMTAENSHVLLIGNPTRTSGLFFDTHHKLSSQWWRRKVSCIDSPRVTPEYIEEMKYRYSPESTEYRIRVLGEFPEADDNTVIPLHLVESAIEREVEIDEDAPLICGVDVARFGDNYSVLCKRRGRVVVGFRRWRGLDLMQLTGALMSEFEALGGRDAPQEILVDSVGVGGGLVDRLQELGLPVVGINSSESPSMGATYLNLRAELWFKVKAWLESREVSLPDEDSLIAELVAPRYQFTSTGKTKLEGKDDLKKRGVPSPDMADALALTFASEGVIGLKGRKSSNWGAPLKRGIKGIV